MRLVSVSRIGILAAVISAAGVISLSAQSLNLGGNSSKSIFDVPKKNLDPRSLSLLDPDRFTMKQS